VADGESRFIVSAGTQVVARVGTGGAALARPLGAVGVIVEEPIDRTHAYRVRFADGGEALLRRSEFAVRKQHQAEGIVPPTDDLFAEYEPHVILRVIVGSRAYGLDESSSDTDRRGIFLPPADRHWSLGGVPEQIERESTQEAFWELEKALVLALKANPNVLETLHSPLVETILPPADELLRERGRFVSRLVYQTYNGYVLSQFKKLQADLRTTGAVRWKHVMHLLRLLLAGIEVLRDGRVPLDVGPERERLLAVRRGEVDWPEVEAWRRELHHAFDAAYRSTSLPERPDYVWADDYLIRARRGMVDR
jgi:hypothetical protein